MQDSDKEKLRAFEKKMHDEGAAGFADGPRPWETWDESGAQAGKHVWEGKARRIYRNTNTPVRHSFGERILSGLAVVALATMVVGIAGVYFTEEQPQTVAWTRVEPTPIPLPGQQETAAVQRLPARAPRPAPVIAEIDSLPPPAAGSTAGMVVIPAPEEAASTAPAMAETGAALADTATAGAASTMATAADDTAAWPSDDNGTDIEIVTAPTALLLRSSGDAYTDSSESASGMEMDTALAMEIATAPAADSDMEDAVAADSPALAATGTDNPWEVVTAPATNLVNRDSITADPAAADSTPPETDIATAGTPATEPDAVSLDGTTTAATLDILPPTAAGPATTAADAAPGEALAQATAIQAGSDTPAQDMFPTGNAVSPLPGDSETTVVALAEPEPAVTEPAPAAAAAAPAGDWVVNLASYTYQSTAKRKLALFQSKGVSGEIERIIINDKPLYRIRVAGFESSRAARASIPELQKTLDLEGAWIARR